MFASKEAEEEAKKVPAKTFTPGEVLDVMDVLKVEEAPKVVAPTPEQITAIKVCINMHLLCFVDHLIYFVILTVLL